MVIQILRHTAFLESNYTISAHRSSDNAHEYVKTEIDCCLRYIIASAGGAAHLAGVLAAKTTSCQLILEWLRSLMISGKHRQIR